MLALTLLAFIIMWGNTFFCCHIYSAVIECDWFGVHAIHAVGSQKVSIVLASALETKPFFKLGDFLHTVVLTVVLTVQFFNLLQCLCH